VGPAVQRLSQPPFRRVVVTDSLPLPAEAEGRNIDQISVANLFARAIRAIHTGESVSALFR